MSAFNTNSKIPIFSSSVNRLFFILICSFFRRRTTIMSCHVHSSGVRPRSLGASVIIQQSHQRARLNLLSDSLGSGRFNKISCIRRKNGSPSWHCTASPTDADQKEWDSLFAHRERPRHQSCTSNEKGHTPATLNPRSQSPEADPFRIRFISSNC